MSSFEELELEQNVRWTIDRNLRKRIGVEVEMAMWGVSREGRWGIYQIDTLTGKVVGGMVGAGYVDRIDAEVECVRSVARTTFNSHSDYVVFDRYPGHVWVDEDTE